MPPLATTDAPELQVFDCEKTTRLCRERGITQVMLAVQTGRGVATVANWLGGRSDPPSSMIAALALILGCHPGDLFRAATEGDVVDVQPMVRVRSVPRRKRRLVRTPITQP